MSDISVEVRIAEMAGEIKTMGIEVKNLVKLMEKDVSALRDDHEHLRRSHKALDQATTSVIKELRIEIESLEHDRTRLKAWGTAAVFVAGALGWLTSFIFEHHDKIGKLFG